MSRFILGLTCGVPRRGTNITGTDAGLYELSGLYAEEVSPTAEALGNVPQALARLALIHPASSWTRLSQRAGGHLMSFALRGVLPHFHAATATPLLVGLVTRRGFLVVHVLKGEQQMLWAS